MSCWVPVLEVASHPEGRLTGTQWQDHEVRAALPDVSGPALIASIVHITGDPALLRRPVRPRAFIPNDFQGGMAEDELAQLREAALGEILAWRDTGFPPPPPPGRDVVLETMSWVTADKVPGEYVEMFLEEMDIGRTDPRKIRGIDPAEARRQELDVLVVGCGASGLLAGVRLAQAGVHFTIIEKNPDVGGTWFESTYPGCRVDVGNHFYCYSFEPNLDFSEYFCQPPELQHYFRSVMRHWGVDRHVEWNSEVLSAEWDEACSRWVVTTRGPAGERRRSAAVMILATGQLNRPLIPDFPGLSSFAGPVFHTARWDHSVDLADRKVAMIGAGASGFQVAPAIAGSAQRLTIFQRSAQWMSPNPRYRHAVAPGARWAMRHLPGYWSWYRFMLLYQSSDKALALVKIDPDWQGMPYSANRLSEERRKILVEWIERHLGDKPELLERVIPDYPPMGKRLLQDDGSWLRTLRRDNVELVRDPLVRIEPDAVVTSTGRYPSEVIIMATGFETDHLLGPVEISGRAGVGLSEQWGTAPTAHLGITVPGFPNLFLMYGPGTNLAQAGSIIFHSECQMQFIGSCLSAMLAGGHRIIEVRPEAHDAYVERLQQELARTVWAHPAVRHSWYKGPDGKVYVLSPWRLVDYWRMTKWPDLSEYEMR